MGQLMSAIRVQNCDTLVSLPSERRGGARLKSNYIGSIFFNNSKIEKCLIQNISTGGAEIVRYFCDKLPERFQLEIHPEIILNAKVAWQHEQTFGIQFDLNKAS